MECSNEERTCSCFNTERIQLWSLGLVWFVFNEKQGKQESLNHYRIIMGVADQNALQEQPLNFHKVDHLEKQCNSAMNYSTL